MAEKYRDRRERPEYVRPMRKRPESQMIIIAPAILKQSYYKAFCLIPSPLD